MGRNLLYAAAALLFVTAIIHGCGQPMIDEWIAGLPEQQKQALCLVWMTDSISWAVVAAIWAMAGWKQAAGWIGASVAGAVIPLATAVGIMAIEPRFFGGWMLLGSVALAAAGLALARRTAADGTVR